MSKSIRWFGLMAVLALVVTGCSSVSTGPDEVALHYEGGSFSSQKFKGCVDPSKKEWDGPSDTHPIYPNSQRNLAFPDKGDNTKSITFVTKDGIEMSVSGILNFRLNTDCTEQEIDGKNYKGGVLQYFHELIGRRMKAYFDDSGEVSDGWIDLLGKYIYKPLDTAVDRAAQQYTYTQLYNDAATKAQWEQDVLAQLPALVDRQTDGEVSFFDDYALTLQKPDPPQAIKDALLEQQKAVAEANAAKAKADAQVAQAEAEAKVAAQEAIKQQNVIAGFGNYENFLRWYMASMGLNPLQPTYTVGGPAPKP